jgi:hypothetical protein
MSKIAALTMVYNEAARLPRWLDYYGRQLGEENLYVLDHGSTDGSTAGLRRGGVRRLPRAPKLDETFRVEWVQKAVGSLLSVYDWVVATDVDEFLVPLSGEPLARHLQESRLDTITALGFNLLHSPTDPPLDPAQALLEQRPRCRLHVLECKPLATRRPVRWTPGFHCSDQPVRFDDLLLFHSRFADEDLLLAQAQKYRAIEFAHPQAGIHWRSSDEALKQAILRENASEFIELTLEDVQGWERELEGQAQWHPAGFWTFMGNGPRRRPCHYVVPPALRQAL